MQSSAWINTARLADVSHWQREDDERTHYRLMDWAAAVRAGLVGAIVKYSQGVGSVDLVAAGHIARAYDAGVPLHGGYHFGDGSDPEKQAAHFLDVAHQHWGDLDGIMLMLDAERNTPQMSVRQAEIFVSAVRSNTGRWPWLYMGRYGPTDHEEGLPSVVLSHCALLLPKYGPPPTANNLPPGFRLPKDGADRGEPGMGVLRAVQFTNGTTNGGPFPGLGRVDQSRLVGLASLDELRAVWAPGERLPRGAGSVK